MRLPAPSPLRSAAVVAALGLATACSSSQPDFEAAASPSPSAPVELACVDFPQEAAEQLIADPATGQRRIEGALRKAVSVQTPTSPEGATVHVIALDVEGKYLALVHLVTEKGGPPNGEGPFAALTGNTAAATGIPEDPQLERLADGSAVSFAIRCLTS
jgi:hypothetical protein